MLHKQAAVIIGAVIISTVVSSMITWRMVYPRAILAAKAELLAETHSESVEVGRVVAEMQIVMPVSHKKTRPQDIARIIRYNIAQMEAIDTSHCPQDFQHSFHGAEWSILTYANLLEKDPISWAELTEDGVVWYESAGVPLPLITLVVGQVASGNRVLAARISAMDESKAALIQLQRVAARYDVRM